MAACGGNAATSAPATPTTAPVFTFALPSFTADTELEAMFPDSVGGKTLTVRSMSGADFMTLGGSGMAPALQQLGKTPSDMTVAFGGTADASLVMVAFRIK